MVSYIFKNKHVDLLASCSIKSSWIPYHISKIFYIFKSNMNMSFKEMTDSEVGNINGQ